MKYEIRVWEPHHRGVPISLWRKIGEIMAGGKKESEEWIWVNDPKFIRAANLQKELDEATLIGTPSPTVGIFWEDDIYTFRGYVQPHPLAEFAGVGQGWLNSMGGVCGYLSGAPMCGLPPQFPAYPIC